MSQQTPSSSVQNILHMLAAARRPARRQEASASPPPAAGADLAALLSGPYGPQIAALLSGQAPVIPPPTAPIGGSPSFAGAPQPWPMQPPPFGFHPGPAAPMPGQHPVPPHMASPFGFIAPITFAQPQAAGPAAAPPTPAQTQGHPFVPSPSGFTPDTPGQPQPAPAHQPAYPYVAQPMGHPGPPAAAAPVATQFQHAPGNPPGAQFLGFFASPASPGSAAVQPTTAPSSASAQAANRSAPRDSSPAQVTARIWTAGNLSFGAAAMSPAAAPRADGSAVPPAGDPTGERELDMLSAHIDTLIAQRDALRVSLVSAPPPPAPTPESTRQHVEILAGTRGYPAEQVAALLESLHAILHDLQAEHHAEHQRQQAEHGAELQRVHAEHRAELQRIHSEHRAELRRILDVVQATMRDDAIRVQEQIAQIAAEQHRILQTALCGLHDLFRRQISGPPRSHPDPEPPPKLSEETDGRAVVRLARPDPNTSQRASVDASSPASDARGSPPHEPAHRMF